MNQNQLKALAREYAEQYLPLSDPDLTKSDRDDMVNTMADYAEEIFQWLTKTHLIVKKEKVKEIHHACSKTIDCGWYGTESAIQRLSLLEELFDPDILNGEEVDV